MYLGENIDKSYFDNINVIEFKEELYSYVKNMNFSNLNLDILFNEIKESKEFENRILEATCYHLGYDYQDLIDNLDYNRIETDREDINKLITVQEERIKKLLIQFVYEELPFNYLMKISKIRGKFNIKKDIREDLIKLLNDEIAKSRNLEETLNILQDSIDSKTQSENFKNLSRKIDIKANKVIIENKFLIGIIDEITNDNLIKLVDNICKDKMVWDNLFD